MPPWRMRGSAVSIVSLCNDTLNKPVCNSIEFTPSCNNMCDICPTSGDN